jgi:lipopolysaccharide/colanic/teichoic acid biosynthesis glycosyltransferase
VSLSHNGIAAKRTVKEPVSTTNGTMQSRFVTENGEGLNGSLRSELLNEKSLTRLLSLERKRSDRSGRRFILLLLDVGELLKSKHNVQPFYSFVDALSESTRETDVKGWYKDSSVFAVIFTEIGNGDAKAITKVLLDKVTNALSSTLRVDHLNDIRLSFHVYPEDIPKSGDGRAPDLTLYPDQIPEHDPKRASRVVKRMMDIFGSLSAVIVLSPLFLAIALAIKLTSRGPVLFRQKRVGRYGAMFTFLKFRSMYMTNNDTIHKDYVARFISGRHESETPADQNNVFKLKNDPRVTCIGKLLRRSSLDELPQLLNVLHGEMSLVGPRPPVPYEVACYKPWHKRRLLTVKPGITGLWQVSGRSRVKFDDMVRLDLKYARTWSPWLDIEILLKTPGAVLSGEGAY